MEMYFKLTKNSATWGSRGEIKLKEKRREPRVTASCLVSQIGIFTVNQSIKSREVKVMVFWSLALLTLGGGLSWLNLREY